MGNICRSPAGEGVLRTMAEADGLKDSLEIASAGTIGLHVGLPADQRMASAAARRGYQLTSRGRKITPADLENFDLILTMDESNYRNVMGLTEDPAQRARVRRFCDFCESHPKSEVPDPYYGGPQGFEHVLDLMEEGCRGVLDWVKRKNAELDQQDSAALC